VHAHELHDDCHAPEKGKQLAERINAGVGWGGGVVKNRKAGNLSGDMRKGSRKTGISSLKHRLKIFSYLTAHSGIKCHKQDSYFRLSVTVVSTFK